MARIEITKEELEKHLQEQVSFLTASTESYDAGHTDEAKRLAVTLRVLVHDTKHSTSLLSQLDRLYDIDWLSTAAVPTPGSLAPHGGLVGIAHKADGAADYIAMLDDCRVQRKVSFRDWWSEPVFVDAKRSLSRRQLVLTAANQDGGAHVDSALDEEYAALKRNALNLTVESAGKRGLLLGVEKAAIRQIAHETLKTLQTSYEKKPDLTGVQMITSEMAFTQGSGVKGWTVQVGNVQTMPIEQPRNQLCACGSGRKYKHCHGRVA